MRWYRGCCRVECVICMAYGRDTFFLRYICIHKLVTSIDTRIAFCGTLVPSMKLINCVVSLMYDCSSFIIGWRRVSTKAEILSVGESHPEIIGRPDKLTLCVFVRVQKNWNAGGFGVWDNHLNVISIINVLLLVEFSDNFSDFLRGFLYHWFLEASVVFFDLD